MTTITIHQDIALPPEFDTIDDLVSHLMIVWLAPSASIVPVEKVDDAETIARHQGKLLDRDAFIPIAHYAD